MKTFHSDFNDTSGVEVEVNTTIEKKINEEKNIDPNVNTPIEDQVNLVEGELNTELKMSPTRQSSCQKDNCFVASGTPRSPHKADYATPIKTFHTNPDPDDKKNNLTPNSTPEPQHPNPSPPLEDLPEENPKTEDMGEDRTSGGIVKSCKDSLDKTENPSYKPKPKPILKPDLSDWVPIGPWNINGKLDENFVEAIAQTWIKEWGGEIYKRRADVIAYFYKNPAMLPVRWEQYRAEYLDRYKVAVRTMASGGKVSPLYQKRLVDNHRAITNPLPEELNPVASEPLQKQINPASTSSSELPEVEILDSVNSDQSSVISNQESLDTDFWLEEDPGESDFDAIDDETNAIDEENSAIANNSPLVTESDNSLLTTRSYVVTENNAPEKAENPQAYQKWEPDYLNDPEYQPTPEKAAFMKKVNEDLTEIMKKKSMPPRDKNLREPPKTRIEEINEWLADPSLRDEMRARLKNQLDMYEWVPDEYGRPIKIIDYRF